MNNTFKKRIDELGRIVIPKQIRTTLKIKSYEELEMYIENDNIVMKKSLGLEYSKDKLDNLLLLLKNLYKFQILIVENNKVLSTNSDKILNGERLIINYDNISKENNFVSITLKEDYVSKVYVDSLIYDSNLLGYVVIINDDIIVPNLEDIKNIKNVVIDLLS